MYILTLVIMLSVTLCSYLSDIRLAPQPVKYFPEVLSVIVVIYVLAAGARQRFKFVGTQYWIAFAAIIVVIICGVMANGVAPGPVFGGLRYYLRAMPLFLLPAVLEYDGLPVLAAVPVSVAGVPSIIAEVLPASSPETS